MTTPHRTLHIATRLVTAAGLALALGSLAGCVLVGGTSHRAPSPTAGQELIDLKKALESGAISENEYESMRKHVMHDSGMPS